MMEDKRRDWDLLRQFVDTNSQPAFAELTRRYLGLVHATALRDLGDRTLAEDTAQAVFLIFARKARTFRSDIVLASWLFDTCKLTAKNVRKIEGRRQVRERKIAMEMRHDLEPQSQHSSQITDDTLNEALNALPHADRQAVLLRFVCGYTFTEAGDAVGISEDAARKRIDRALEKLRRIFTKAGAGVTALAAAELLQAQSVQAASPVLEAKIAHLVFSHSTTALAGVSAHTIAQGVLKSMQIMNLKIAAAVTCGVILAGGTAAYRGFAHTAHPISSAKTYRANAVVSHPAMVNVSVNYIDVTPADLDAAAKPIASGPKHDALLMAALIKSGAENTNGPTETAEDGTMGRTVATFQVPMSAITNGKSGKGSMVFGMITDAKPQINPDRSITVELNLQTNVPNPDPNAPPVTAPPAFPERTIKTTRTFVDGETVIMSSTTPTKADPLVHLAFVNVASLHYDIPAEFADIPGAPLDPFHVSEARDMQNDGIMSAQDYLRIRGIQELSRPLGTLTNEQYDFLFSVLKKPTKWHCLAVRTVFATIIALPKIPNDRKEQLYQVALPYLSNAEVNASDNCRIYAGHMMAKLGDKRAIPLMVPLLNDPDANAREKAAEDLKKLGYNVPASAATAK